MTSTKMSGIRLAFFAIFFLIQLVPSSYAVGQKCSLNVLRACNINETCVQVHENTGVCKCLPPFIMNNETRKCEEENAPSEPSSSHLGLGLGLGLTFFLLLVVVALALLHRKFGLFSGMCENLPSLHVFGRRGQDIRMVDNEEDDDVTPIV